MHRAWQRFWFCAAILGLWCGRSSSAAADVTVLDDCSDASKWEAVTSDGVRLKFSVEREADANGEHGTSLRLDYEFKSSGFAGVRLRKPLELPPNFEISFAMRGELPRNHVEFKLVDESGENVWWVNRRAVEFPREWTKFASRRRHFTYAWGPKRDPLTRAGSIEFVISSAEGGRGTVWIDDLAFRELPVTRPYASTPTATASSAADDNSQAAAAIDGDAKTVWRSAKIDPSPTLTVDFQQVREFGGLVIDWDPQAFASSCDVEFSDDGQSWTKVRHIEGHSGRPQFISLPDAESRLVRFSMNPSTGGSVAIREIEVLPWEASRDENAFMKTIADRVPRGRYPRATTGEGVFWTIVGVPIDEHEALVSEDGAVEVDKQAFSLEPFVIADDKLLTWADAKITQSLAEGFAPVPTVTREHDGLRLSVTAAADGKPEHSSVLLMYTLTNTGDKLRTGSFVLAARPFQVNPPYQWLNAMGGVSRIAKMELADSRRELRVDGRVVALGAAPDAFGAATYYEGDVSDYLGEGRLPSHEKVVDAERRASGALQYKFDLAAGGSQSWTFVVPFSQDAAEQQKLIEPFASASDPVESVRKRQAAAVGRWKKLTDTFDLLVPAEATDIVNTIRSTLAYVLVNQDGLAIHPGSRSYERSWIRDGSLTSAALCRFGMEQQAKEFVDWYGPFQFDSGKVPCAVDKRGPDPVPENDSHGEYIMAVMNVYRFTGDKEFLKRHWPRVQKAVAYIE
ncbi:MAG: discoidin domain-containing protein, partial [Pirellulales bacterium]